MILMGVDPAGQSTGYGVIRYQNMAFKALEYGCVQTTSKQELAERIEKLYDNLNEIIRRHRPQEIVIEEIFYARNVRVMQLMCYMRGTVILAGQKNGIHIVEYSAKAIKKSVTGNGGASKAQVGYMTRRLLGLSDTEKIVHDATDALAAALTHGLKITY